MPKDPPRGSVGPPDETQPIDVATAPPESRSTPSPRDAREDVGATPCAADLPRPGAAADTRPGDRRARDRPADDPRPVRRGRGPRPDLPLPGRDRERGPR